MKINDWKNLKAGKKLKIIDTEFTINSVLNIREQNNLGSAVLLKMEDARGFFHLFAKIVDNNIDVRLYNEIEWIGFGDRQRLLNEGHQKLFIAPTGPYVPSDLQWAESIELNINDVSVAYDKKYTWHGEAESNPKESGLGIRMVSITEYAATKSVENPEIIIIELGGIDPNGNVIESGGLVSPFEGRPFDNNSISKVGWFS